MNNWRDFLPREALICFGLGTLLILYAINAKAQECEDKLYQCQGKLSSFRERVILQKETIEMRDNVIEDLEGRKFREYSWQIQSQCDDQIAIVNNYATSIELRNGWKFISVDPDSPVNAIEILSDVEGCAWGVVR